MIRNTFKKLIFLVIVIAMMTNYFLPILVFAESDSELGIEEVGVEQEKETDEVEEVSREYEIKKEEEWDISENEDGSVKAKWTLNNKTLTISGKGGIKDFYETTNSPCTPWYEKYGEYINNIVIEYGITNIGGFVFNSCVNVESIQLADSITQIRGGAFYKCKNLKNINLPSSVKSIGMDGFIECDNLKSIKIPDGVKK